LYAETIWWATEQRWGRFRLFRCLVVSYRLPKS
jgi:hypothetical protein